MTDPARREHENYSGNDLSLASTSTAATPWKGEWRPAADPANRLHGGLDIHKMVHVLPNEKNKCATMRKCRIRITLNSVKHNNYLFQC